MPLSDEMPAELFDAAGNLVGYVTSMQMDQSVTPRYHLDPQDRFVCSTSRVTGTFELTDYTPFLTKENTMQPNSNACAQPAPLLISEGLINAVRHSPACVVNDLQELLNQAYENIEKKEREERKRKKRAKRQRRALKLAELRRENALAVLEEGSHKKIDIGRTTAAMALLDRLEL